MQRESRTARIIRFDTIVQVVCEHLQIRSDQVVGRSRKRLLVLARSMVLYLTRQLTRMSYPEIATALGRNSHSTIVTAVARIKQQLLEDGSVTYLLPDGSDSLSLQEMVHRLRYKIERA